MSAAPKAGGEETDESQRYPPFMVERAGAAGGGAALVRLFTERYADLTRLAYVMTGDRDVAEDLAQDAFVRAWPRLATLRAPESAPAYLRTTLVNLVRQRHRRRVLEWRHPPTRPEPVPPPDDDRSTALDLAEVVRKLPLRKRECIVLRFYADLSEEETARILGISVGTVKSQTHRALRLLAKELESAPSAPLDFDPTRRAKDR
ncbi:SigE family RNA polymerase sigma factor [Actinopolymorpha sp. B9G3]|uniref:SigE family RNA polymerase sigma factor n=1 Tax=Actinopolymorpha sp. B9G3 TaxID=3158970 RepID=UPI0032D91B69